MAETQKGILIVDDEASQRKLLGSFVQSLGFQVQQAGSAEEALRLVTSKSPQMVLLDVRLPGISGIEALPEFRKLAEHLPILLITAHGDLRQAVAAMKGGADDYLVKPIDLDELGVAITDALGQSSGKPEASKAFFDQLPEGLVCDSLAMRRLIETLAVVAPSDAPVLVSGESGVGKEVVAQLIHQWSPRRAAPLVVANCGGLPETLIESELFGHTKGAFTGATQARQGFFRAADGGTLFLDEIGELPVHLQPNLLRALEAKQITPVGSDVPIEVDVRLVAATNRDLEQDVAEGRFREDLYYRINVVGLQVPPLRERRDDILLLARQFAEEFAGRPMRLSPQATQCLLTNNWAGNVRELRNAVQRACLLCRGDIIMPEHLPPKIARLCVDSQQPPDGDANRLSQLERAAILATLAETDGNRTQAAKKLGISRRTLIYKIRAIEDEGS